MVSGNYRVRNAIRGSMVNHKYIVGGNTIMEGDIILTRIAMNRNIRMRGRMISG